jgi:Zn-dependent peptidase ImmA (M78 family)
VTIDNPPVPTSFRTFAIAKEKEAEAFAAELLIPLSLLKDHMKKIII